jgi:hypothetical protein
MRDLDAASLGDTSADEAEDESPPPGFDRRPPEAVQRLFRDEEAEPTGREHAYFAYWCGRLADGTTISRADLVEILR